MWMQSRLAHPTIAHYIVHHRTPTLVRTVAPSAGVEVVVAAPEIQAAKRIFVDIRQPDGTIRSFPLAGGEDTILVRRTVVRPGQQLVLHVGEAPAKQ